MFKKKEIFKVKAIVLDPDTMTEPKTAEDFIKRGMAYYARKLYDAAEKDLKQAVLLDPKSVDGYYSLGMVYKAAKMTDQSIEAFGKAVDLIQQGVIENRSKAEMLRRLALGHANELRSGDWNLEKEIWRRVP
jgi:tetratricopeptide (TPR) repeat protein